MYSSVKSVNGLLGLLSTISLNTETDRIDIYGPKHLLKYVFWGRKYSKTNFRCKLYFYNTPGKFVFHQSVSYSSPLLYFYSDKHINCCLFNHEQPAAFDYKNATKYNVPFGPICGYFKIGQNFILPDGFIAYGINFVYGHYLGNKVFFINPAPQSLEVSLIESTICPIGY